MTFCSSEESLIFYNRKYLTKELIEQHLEYATIGPEGRKPGINILNRVIDDVRYIVVSDEIDEVRGESSRFCYIMLTGPMEPLYFYMPLEEYSGLPEILFPY